MVTNFQKKVYELVSQIPKGKVSTYKIIAQKMNTNAYQAIGQALMKNPFAPDVPCHRVVSSDGTIGGFKGESEGKAIEEKISMLKKERIKIKNNRIIDFEKRLFTFL